MPEEIPEWLTKYLDIAMLLLIMTVVGFLEWLDRKGRKGD